MEPESPFVIEERARLVRPILSRLLGRDPGKLVHQPFGHGSVVFLLPDLDPPLVAKTSDRPNAFARTGANLTILRAIGLPVPNLVASESDELAVLVLEWIPGTDLRDALPAMSGSQRENLATQIVEMQIRVGALPLGEGFGWTPIGVAGEFPTWLAVVERDVDRLDPFYRDQLASPLRRLGSYLRHHPPIPFLDDLTVKNVIVKDGRLQGIVDLDVVCYGDPLHWLALAETTLMLDLGEDGTSYAHSLRRLWAPNEIGHRVADLYSALFAAHFLGSDLNSSVRGRMDLFFRRRLRHAAQSR